MCISLSACTVEDLQSNVSETELPVSSLVTPIPTATPVVTESPEPVSIVEATPEPKPIVESTPEPIIETEAPVVVEPEIEAPTNETQTTEVEAPVKEEPVAKLVWIPTNGGKKFHTKKSCSNMDDPIQVTQSEAIDQGFEACKRCH